MCLPMKVTVSLWFMTCFMSCVCRWRSLFPYDSWHVLCHVFADEGHCFLMIHNMFYVMCLPMKVTVSLWFMTCFMSCVCRWRSLFLYDSWHVLCHVFADEGHCFFMIHDMFYVMCLPMKVTVSLWFMTCFMSCVCQWRSLFPYDSWHVLCHVFADEGHCFLMIHDMFYVMCLPMKVTVSLWFMTCFMSCVCRWRTLFLHDSWHVLCHVFADKGQSFFMIYNMFYVMCLPMKVTVSLWVMTCFMSYVCRWRSLFLYDSWHPLMSTAKRNIDETKLIVEGQNKVTMSPPPHPEDSLSPNILLLLTNPSTSNMDAQ